MSDFPIFRKSKEEESTAHIRSITIYPVEYEGSYACDVDVVRRDNTKKTHPTRLYSTLEAAISAAKNIRDMIQRHEGRK